MTRHDALWGVPLGTLGGLGAGRLGLGRVGAWFQLSGGTGPDAMAMDVEKRVSVAHPGMGSVSILPECSSVFGTQYY